MYIFHRTVYTDKSLKVFLSLFCFARALFSKSPASSFQLPESSARARHLRSEAEKNASLFSAPGKNTEIGKILGSKSGVAEGERLIAFSFDLRAAVNSVFEHPTNVSGAALWFSESHWMSICTRRRSRWRFLRSFSGKIIFGLSWRHPVAKQNGGVVGNIALDLLR